MNDAHYGWVVNTHYDWINMLIKMKEQHPKRFEEFDYSHSLIYEYLDKLQQEQNVFD